MKLQIRLHSDKAVIYREKWGVLAFMLLTGSAALILPILFYLRISASEPNLSHHFLMLLCGALALLGLVILLRIPRHLKRLIQDNGSSVLVADANGIRLASVFSANSQLWPWESITEIAVAERLKIIDHETTHSGCSLVFFLPPVAHESLSWFDRLILGISKSGRGRAYLKCQYPQGEGVTIESAIQQFTPGSVRVKRHQRVVFDCLACVDIYSDLSIL